MDADPRKMRRATEREYVKAIKVSAKVQGCCCSVEVVINGWITPALPRAEVRHDDWCPLLREMEERGPDRSPQAVVFDPELFS